MARTDRFFERRGVVLGAIILQSVRNRGIGTCACPAQQTHRPQIAFPTIVGQRRLGLTLQIREPLFVILEQSEMRLHMIAKCAVVGEIAGGIKAMGDEQPDHFWSAIVNESVPDRVRGYSALNEKFGDTDPVLLDSAFEDGPIGCGPAVEQQLGEGEESLLDGDLER